MPWEYDDDDLITLCEDCHKEVHLHTVKLKPRDEDNYECGYDMGVKVGDFVHYSHSDYDNFGIVYHIDKRKQIAKAVFSDDGSGFDGMWFAKFDSNFLIDNFYDVCLLKPTSLYEEDFDPDLGYSETSFFTFIKLVADFYYHVWNEDDLFEYSFYDCFNIVISFDDELQLIRTNFKQMIENNDAISEYIKQEFGV